MDTTQQAQDLLRHFDTLTPANGDDMRELYKERGWVEAIQYLSERGMLTPEGEQEAGKILAASGEWARDWSSDLTLPPVTAADADEPLVR